MLLIISITIFFQSISLHYTGDNNTKKLLFSGSNQFQEIDRCIDNCVDIKVNGKKVNLVLKSQGEVVRKKYNFSKNKVFGAQFADLLRLKILLFKKEYRKKIERRYYRMMRYELETKIKADLEEKIKIDLEEKIKTDLEKKIKDDLEIKIKIELKNRIKKELAIKIKELNLNGKQKNNLKIELDKIESKIYLDLEKKISINLEKKLNEKNEKNIELKLKELKVNLKKEIKLELLNEQKSKDYNNFLLAGNINMGIMRDYLASGILFEYKKVSDNIVTNYTISFLMRNENNNIDTNFLLLQISKGKNFKIKENIDLEFTIGGFSSIVNLIDEKDWFFAWETTGGVVVSANGSILFNPKWGMTFKSDLSLFLVNYRNTEKDGLYGNKKISTSFSLGTFYRF